ncbi:glycosyl transferase family 8 domain-containing protein [Ditylenchus destructor]|uniref:glycogenin glucosyltransferase n=1 Tax=Ditylenchus destructor TaxID=166010 RepID=A0AAD4R3W3_9BILA|nr:glycosyl transferase family 8 domain-containing protein [Ditylenchus destructor]
MAQGSTAWVTLATNDGYAIGALVLAQSLRNVGTQHPLHIMYTSGVSPPLKEQLLATFDASNEVNVLDSNDSENLALIGRPDLGVTFTKLHCWRLTQYSKCVFLDADTFILQNCDELFSHPELSAAPDIGWPDHFNTGVFVYVPSEETYQNILQFALSYGSFDGGDQGLLNQYFHNWREQDASHRLPFTYNVTSSAIYAYAAAIKRHAQDIKIIHFLGKQKPWQHYGTGGQMYVSEYLQKWQQVYIDKVQQCLPTSLVRHSRTVQVAVPSRSNLVSHTKDQSTHGPQTVALASSIAKEVDSDRQVGPSAGVPEESRYAAWEFGQPDYTGKDSFENIQKQIEKSLE